MLRCQNIDLSLDSDPLSTTESESPAEFSLAKLTTLLESPDFLRILSPWKELLASMVRLAVVSLPSASPPEISSIESHSALPLNLPATTRDLALRSLLTLPVCPILTVPVEVISPSTSPSMWSSHCMSILPEIIDPAAIVVTFDE